MSYLQDLGVDFGITAIAAQPLLKPPFPGAVWVPPAGARAGYWKRPTTTAPVATVTQSYPPGSRGYFQQLCKKEGIDARNVAACTRYLEQVKKGTPKKWEAAVKLYKASVQKGAASREHRPIACEAAGLPPELVPHCQAALQSGLSLEEFMVQLEALSPEELEAVMGGAGAAPSASSKGKILLYGGAAAAALVLVLLLRKKKKR